MAYPASDLVSVESNPTDPSQLWALAYLFACDWSGPLKLHCAYSTDVAQAASDTEQRRGLIRNPSRIIEVDLLVNGANQIGLLRSFLLRAANARFLFPLYMDEAICMGMPNSTTLSFASGIVPVRRFFSGYRIACVKFAPGRDKVLDIQIAQLAAGITSTTIPTMAALTGDLTGYSIYPLIEAELMLEQLAINALTDQCLQFTMTVNESRGQFSLLSAYLGNFTGDSFNGYTVLNVDPDFDSIAIGFHRSGEYQTVGRGKVVQLYGTQARARYTLQFTQLDRVSAYALINWFGAAGGRLYPFYLKSPLTDFHFLSMTTSSITVKTTMVDIDWQFYKALCLIMSDGTVQYCTISSVTVTTGQAVISTSALTVGGVVKLSCLHLVRFDTDEFIESWINDSVMQVDTPLELIEVTRENAVAITNFKDLAQGY